MKQKENQENEKEVEKPEKNKEKVVSNREMAVVTYIFIGLYIILLGYFTKFLLQDNSTILSSSYNKRQDLLAERVQRGKIISSDGKVLAETVTDKKNNEYRSYPYDNLFCHIVGINSNGKTGIELSQNYNLLTSSINPVFTLINQIKGEKDVGNDVVTTLNVKMQQAAYEGLGNNKGAVVVLEPSTGKILAMVSKPDYDPNKIDSSWDKLRADAEENSALLNRATQGLYPPGSTFKIVTALEYLRENNNKDQFNYLCKGSSLFDGVKINCYKNEKHGKVNLESAFEKSCNGAFAQIGLGLNIPSFRSLCDNLLFNKKLPVDFEHSASSFSIASDTDPAEITQTSIGQGKTTISPLHNAMIVSSILNKGILMKPYVVDQMKNDEKVIKETEPTAVGNLMNEDESKELIELMDSVVTSGTARSLSSSSYKAGGKTGSAEFDEESSSHAWFVGYATKNNKTIVVSIVVEGAGTGSEYAVPIAKRIFETKW